MNAVLFLIGLSLSVGTVFLYKFLLGLSILNKFLENPYLDYNSTILLLTLLLVFLFYYVLVLIGLNRYKKAFTYVNGVVLKLLKDRSEKFETDDLFLKPIFENLNLFKNQFAELEKFYAEKRKELQSSKDELRDILNSSDAMIFKVTVDGKVLDANDKAVKFFGYKSTFEFNKKYDNLSSAFDNKLPKDWITKNVDKIVEVMVHEQKFQVYINKLPNIQEYMIFMRNVNSLEKKIEELEKLAYFDATSNLYNHNKLNRNSRVVLIEIDNYKSYSKYLSDDIIALFIVKFVDRIKEVLDGDYNICRLVYNRFSIEIDEKIDLKEFKKSIEKTLTVFVGSNKFIFNPVLSISGGENYEKAKKALLEATPLSPKWDDEIRNVDLSNITILNESIFENRVTIKYRRVIINSDAYFHLKPVLRDKFSSDVIDDPFLIKLSYDLILYLKLIKTAIFSNIEAFKGKKIFIDVKESDFYYQNDFVDLVKMLKSNSIDVVFNMSIESDYKFGVEIIKILKKYDFKVSLDKIGVGYFNISDIYNLKIDYIKIDESLDSLIARDNRWKFIVTEFNNVIKYGKTQLISINSSNTKIDKKYSVMGSQK